jgi:hypothetical protein
MMLLKSSGGSTMQITPPARENNAKISSSAGKFDVAEAK